MSLVQAASGNGPGSSPGTKGRPKPVPGRATGGEDGILSQCATLQTAQLPGYQTFPAPVAEAGSGASPSKPAKSPAW